MKTSDEILNLMRKNKNITIDAIAEKLGITARAIKKQIANLKSKNLINRIGSARKGYWEI